MPTIYIISGPNGAGKTTAAYTLLPEVFKVVEFVNADEIARGLSPFNPEGVSFHAGRIMLERLEQLISEKKDFAFETTLSGLHYLNFIRDVKAKGYKIFLFFIWLDSIELAINRVKERVNKGGHNIPVDIIKRRYYKGLKNLNDYTNAANYWIIYNNSGTKYELIAKQIDNKKEIINFDIYKKITGNDK
jgi:predicted ABC-type ATPase